MIFSECAGDRESQEQRYGHITLLPCEPVQLTNSKPAFPAAITWPTLASQSPRSFNCALKFTWLSNRYTDAHCLEMSKSLFYHCVTTLFCTITQFQITNCSIVRTDASQFVITLLNIYL